MKIAYLIAGTGSFYCGTCLRDHALVMGMRQKGHDVKVMPLYLPLVVEGQEEEGQIHLGGVNAYLQHKIPIFRYTPGWFDRIFDWRPLLNLAAKMSGMTKAKDLGELTVASLKGINGSQRKEFKRIVNWLKEGQFDLICLSNVLLSSFAPAIKEAMNIPVICSLQGEDSYLDKLPESYSKEAWKLLNDQVASVDRYVAISNYYGKLMQKRVGIPDDKLAVVHCGIPLDGFDKLERPQHQDHIVGYLTQVIASKGAGLLVDAFITLYKRNSIKNLKLHVAGSTTPGNESYIDTLKKKLDDAGITDYQFSLNITRNEKLKYLSEISVLSVPTTYGESFGLYQLEALAAGTPLVQPNHAAFPEVIEATGGGVLCEPDSKDSLADKLEELIKDEDKRLELGQKGKEAVFQKFSNQAMTSNFLKVIDSIRQ